MAKEDSDFEFIAPVGFEWNDPKSRANLDKHGIDFDGASEIFYGPIVLRQSDRNNEERWIAIGSLEQIDHRCVHTTCRRHPNHLSAAREEK